eukprot:1046253-Pyramimonas_sp.AAC.1
MVKKSKDSAPGLDGVPYSAWRAGGPEISSSLYRLYEHLLDFGSLGPGFNHGVSAFLPKGKEEAGTRGQTRMADCTRPLTLSNTDNKLIASAICRPLTRLAVSVCSGVQKGFIPGRQGLDRVIDLDSQIMITNDIEGNFRSGACLFD